MASRKTRVSFAAICAAALGIGGNAFIAAPAHAVEAPVTVRVERNERAALDGVDEVNDELRRKMDAVEENYLDRAARQGRPLDAREVETLTDPNGSVIAAVGDAIAIDGIDVGTYRAPDGKTVVQGVGVRVHGVAEADGATAAVPVIGFIGTPTSNGYLQEDSDRITVTSAHDPDIHFGGQTQEVVSEYWKYKLPENLESGAFGSAERANSDFWVYARRGIATPKSRLTNLLDMTIRSRPWGGTAGNIRKKINNAPVGTTSACTSRGSIGVSHGGASVDIPLSNCKDVTGLSTVSSELEFGADWSGVASSQQAVEAIASFKTKQGVAPVFADYIWAEFVQGTTLPFPTDRLVNWKDTGW